MTTTADRLSIDSHTAHYHQGLLRAHRLVVELHTEP